MPRGLAGGGDSGENSSLKTELRIERGDCIHAERSVACPLLHGNARICMVHGAKYENRTHLPRWQFRAVVRGWRSVRVLCATSTKAMGEQTFLDQIPAGIERELDRRADEL